MNVVVIHYCGVHQNTTVYHHCPMADCRISRCNKIILTWICYCTDAETLCLWITKMLNGWRGVEESRIENRIGAPASHVKGWGLGVSWGNEGGFECISRLRFHVQSAEPIPHQTHPNDGYKNKSSSTAIIHYLFLHVCVCVCVCACMQHLRGRDSIRAPWQIRRWGCVGRVTVFALL